MCRYGRVWETGWVHVFVRHLMGLGLPDGDWALSGTGPLLLRGWIDDVGDLDVISRGPAWEVAKGLGEVTTLSDGNQLVSIEPGVSVGCTWPYGDVSVDELIDTAEVIDGIPCVRLEHIVTYKRIMDRPKDRVHIALIEAHSPD